MEHKISVKDFYRVIRILKSYVKDLDVPVVDMIAINNGGVEKILVATILSSRTKDEVTIKAVDRLFNRINKIHDLRDLELSEIEKLIYPVGFYKTKAANLKRLPYALEEMFNGQVPKKIEELMMLPGVGRKTANLVNSVGFGDDGLCVDTHVHRITNRLGFIDTKTPFDTEMELKRRVDKKYWRDINFIFVAYGQNLCKPISPYCSRCVIYDICKRNGVSKSR